MIENYNNKTDMPFRKGESGNPEGRPKGSVNKAGAELRGRIEEFLNGHFHVLEMEFYSMDMQEKLKLYQTLLPYCLAKKQELSIESQLSQLQEHQLDEILENIKVKIQDNDKEA